MKEGDYGLAYELRAARLLRGWSHGDLATAARVAPSIVADVELARPGPSPEAKAALLGAVRQDYPGTRADAPLEQRASGQPLRWVEATDLTEWGRTRDGQDSLPELINRLIRAEYGLHARLRFPSGDSVAQAGWDGQSLVERETEFVPHGAAGWEIGAGDKHPKTKADEDWVARSTSPDAPDAEWLGARCDTTLMVVTAHRWTAKDDWVAQRRREGVWRDVRVLDAESLAHWIERHPAVGYWLAIKRGKRPPDVQALSDLWEDWALATHTPMSAELSLVGRDREAADLVSWLRGPPALRHVQADSVEEAAAFLHACIAVLPEPYQSAFLTRAIVPGSAEAARQLADALTPLILVLTEADVGFATTLARRGHHVFLAVGPDPSPGDVITLGRPRRWDLLHALLNTGIAFDAAERLSRDAGRSLTTLRRLMPPAPGRLPQWATTPPSRALVAALLAGGWIATHAADQTILETLSGLPYEAFERAIAPHLAALDGPLRRTQDLWRLKSPRDAWGLLAATLTDGDVRAVLAAASQVFGEVDPTYHIEPAERWMAAIKGVQPTYSGALTGGLADTLILLSLVGDAAPAARDVRRRTERMVADLLALASGEHWWSLAPILPKLAEAAPDAFLGAVRTAMAGDPAPISSLFEPEDDRGRIQSRHIHLIWALERLGWDPAHLCEVADILAGLIRFDPGGRNITRPLAQLGRIFLAWSPQTNAGPQARRAVLDDLRARHPDVAWQVMLHSVPVPGGIVFSGNRAQWREEGADRREDLTDEALTDDLEALGERLAADVGEDVERWTSLLEIMERLTPAARARIGEVLDEIEPRIADPAERDRLRTALRKCFDRHMDHQGAWWAIPSEELRAVQCVQERLEPADPLWRNAWLFSNGTGGFRYSRDWKAAEDAARARRAAAMDEIVANGGLAAVRVLSEMAGRQDWIAEALFEMEATAPWSETFIAEGLIAEEGRSWTLARELLRCSLVRDGRAAVTPWLEHARGDTRSLVRLLLLLRPDREVWTLAEGAGAGVETAYWRQVGVYALHGDLEDLETAVTKLLAVSRARGAVSLVAQRIEDGVESPLILRVLDAVLAEGTDGAEGIEEGYGSDALVSLFRQLAECSDTLTAQKAMQLEWAYFEVLRHTDYPALRLREALATDPSAFVQMLTLAYEPDPESGVTEPPLDEAMKPQARQAWRLLDECRPIAGSDATGEIDGEALRAWTDEVRARAAEVGRLPTADTWIGKTLGGARRDQQGPWPPAAVAALLDVLDSERLSEAFVITALYPGGVTMRMPSDGGRQEKDIAARYRRDADALAPMRPVTARLLRQIADGYTDRARREDDQAEHHAWSS